MLPLENFDLEDLAKALENHFMDYDTFFWVDPATGKIELWGEEAADEAEAEGWDLDSRGGIPIEAIESYEGYRDMEDFISALKDPECRDQLAKSIDRSKPFRHFKDALQYYPEILAQWYEFHDARMKYRAVEWLRDNGLVEPAEADAALQQLRDSD